MKMNEKLNEKWMKNEWKMNEKNEKWRGQYLWITLYVYCCCTLFFDELFVAKITQTFVMALLTILLLVNTAM
jgi:hypothetical protein